MAPLYCGQIDFVYLPEGAALWLPYRLAAAEWLHPGRNTVEMVVTADTAVRYGDDMPYGLKGINR